MQAVLIAVVSFVGFLVAYHTYGRWLARKIFKLNPKTPTPAHTMTDGVDYVPARRAVLFGHHYASIAGTGPIVGPAIGIIWGWLPALLWIVLGSIFMGAVHDFGALVVSARNQGKSIGELTRNIINPRVKVLLLLVIFFSLLIVIAIFALVIAVLFKEFPEVVLPVWLQIPIAIGFGYALLRWPNRAALLSIGAVVLMYVTVVLGARCPIARPETWQPTQWFTVWAIVLFIYAYIASVLPVQVLLQPRDYINFWQLFIALGLLVGGLFVTRPALVAPVVQWSPKGAPPIYPFIFITIACGAISGFHSLVGSGTSSKQLDRETDAQVIGYGGMLMEGVLAVMVLLAVAAGLGLGLTVGEGEAAQVFTGHSAWHQLYQSWIGNAGLADKLRGFVQGGGNMIEGLGIPKKVALTIIGVFICSFAGTTLDTATRLQRYIVSELAGTFRFRPFTGRYAATAVAVITAGALCLLPGLFSPKYAGGQGGMILWPIFGTTNQLLAGLALMVLTVYLLRRGSNYLITLIPMLFMMVMPGTALVMNLIKFFGDPSTIHLFIIGLIIAGLEVWMIVEAALFVRAHLRGEKPDLLIPGMK
ncbi:MAG: carbon starvation protein A [Planctomycetes bacterium]|nr:carbon starvation protein A [Planctomycetota bacterium]